MSFSLNVQAVCLRNLSLVEFSETSREVPAHGNLARNARGGGWEGGGSGY